MKTVKCLFIVSGTQVKGSVKIRRVQAGYRWLYGAGGGVEEHSVLPQVAGKWTRQSSRECRMAQWGVLLVSFMVNLDCGERESHH